MKYPFLLENLKKQKDFKELLSSFKEDSFPVAAFGLSHILRVVTVAAAAEALKIKPLIITPSDADSERVFEDLSSLGLDCSVLPSRDYCFLSSASSSHEYEHKRIGTLSKILERDFGVVVASAEAALSKTVPPAVLKQRCRTLEVGQEKAVEDIAELLINSGYTRSEQVDGAGQFSVRGSILDVFSPNMPFPCRIDFFGDEIDSISYFDALTQRRTEEIKAIKIFPTIENAPENMEQFLNNLEKLSNKKNISVTAKKRILEDLERAKNGATIAYDAYLDLCFSETATVFDYFKELQNSGDTTAFFVFDTNAVNDSINSFLQLHFEQIKALLEEGVLPPGFKSVYLDGTQFSSLLTNENTVFCDSFSKTSYNPSPNKLISFKYDQTGLSSRTAKMLAEDLLDTHKKLTVILAGGEKSALVLQKELSENGVSAIFAEPEKIGTEGIYVTTGILSSGLNISSLGLSVIAFGRSITTTRRKKWNKGTAVGSLEELSRGDYVVHATHGIGIFSGVQQITAHGMTRDYIKISYKGNDALYVPVTSLDLVSKYIGNSEDGTVKINKLGSTDWTKTRSRVKKAVKDMAKQLTALYAKRMSQKGFAFSPDGDLQSDFESRFAFDETEDQLRCADEIKRDMERAVPMDRLLCGDVGLGKTEVALRAAFKCIAEGKQCAILVPTTILAWQHYNTALERFSNMAVEIEMLSRFRTKGEQEKIKKNLAVGNIDLIIGTHAIISKDVKFKDLGLIIVDEEQRFGVAQKEKLKELFPSVDALTLSATPIPRTLNMALSGLRDMSSIEEAPQDRRPVQTYVLEQNTAVITEAINKELRRDGQVYYLHNRTESIDSCAFKISERHPDAKVAVAHGKMGEEELSKVWKQLIEHEIDILVCTTIIETGVDVPNCNTLIIENADRFGLAQLHQLRGRVGRSHRSAYAYLMFTPQKALSEISQKRLDAIRRFTEFGSGFKIAMRDLEIRGAGSILGGEQHGHMEAVGYDMYLKMLSDAIAEEKGETVIDTIKECLVDIRISAHIPEQYISSLPQRLAAYRRIASIRTNEDVLDVTDELLDRYGDLPRQVEDLISVSFLKNIAASLGITEISERNDRLLLYVEGLTEPVSRLITSSLKKRVLFSAGTKPYLAVKPEGKENMIETLKQALDAMRDSSCS